MKKGLLLILIIILTLSSLCLAASTNTAKLKTGFLHSKSLNEFSSPATQMIKKDINEMFDIDLDKYNLYIQEPIYSLTIDADIELKNKASLARIILVDKDDREYLVYESYYQLMNDDSFSVTNICEETCILDGITPDHLRMDIEDAAIEITNVHYSSSESDLPTDIRIDKRTKINELRIAQSGFKIEQFNDNDDLLWSAGDTGVSDLTYEEKKHLLGGQEGELERLPNLQGFEYYKGGLFVIENTEDKTPIKKSLLNNLFNARSSTGNMVVSDSRTDDVQTYLSLSDRFTWTNFSSKDWITEVKDQENCGSCWAHAALGVIESTANIYYNDPELDLDLSEQDLVCEFRGSCESGGFVQEGLETIEEKGILEEDCMPYCSSETCCPYGPDGGNYGCNDPSATKWTIHSYDKLTDKSDENLKRTIIEKGPVSLGVDTWFHIMLAVGYDTIEEGDKIYKKWSEVEKTEPRIIKSGDDLVGETAWLVKNSWSKDWGELGYGYITVKENKRIQVNSVNQPYILNGAEPKIPCNDNDEDNYCWWGISDTKPDSCPISCHEEKDCDDSDPTIRAMDLDTMRCTISDASEAFQVIKPDQSECEDGIDNNGNGAIDREGGCDLDGDGKLSSKILLSNGEAISEKGMTEATCLIYEGIIEDEWNENTDVKYYGPDITCYNEDISSETPVACNDLEDNDGDGNIDAIGHCDSDGDCSLLDETYETLIKNKCECMGWPSSYCSISKTSTHNAVSITGSATRDTSATAITRNINYGTNTVDEGQGSLATTSDVTTLTEHCLAIPGKPQWIDADPYCELYGASSLTENPDEKDIIIDTYNTLYFENFEGDINLEEFQISDNCTLVHELANTYLRCSSQYPSSFSTGYFWEDFTLNVDIRKESESQTAITLHRPVGYMVALGTQANRDALVLLKDIGSAYEEVEIHDNIIDKDRWYDVKIEAYGNEINVDLDGIRMISFVDEDYEKDYNEDFAGYIQIACPSFSIDNIEIKKDMNWDQEEKETMVASMNPFRKIAEFFTGSQEEGPRVIE